MRVGDEITIAGVQERSWWRRLLRLPPRRGAPLVRFTITSQVTGK